MSDDVSNSCESYSPAAAAATAAEPEEKKAPETQAKAGSTEISVAEFLSVCIYLSEECGKIIREVHESSDLKTAAKGVNNPVTIADLRV